MIDGIVENSRCTGCSACSNVCPQKCIDMIEDKEGFRQPKVIKEKCIKCKKCIKTCPVLNTSKSTQSFEKVFAAYSKDENNRLNSSSGGCFGEFAKFIIQNNGAIFGVGYDKEFNVIHKCVEKIEEIDEIKGSKYVQSYIGNSYIKTKELLEKNKVVLFSGTPCQIVGLKNMLGKDYENLYTIDIICHGVPSQKAFNKYLEEIGNKGEKIESVNFRDKTYGWKKFGMKIEKEYSSRIISKEKSEYMKAFLNNICLRESCYNCTFKGNNIKSDITLGDFWGIDNIIPEFNDDKGASILLVHTQKGMNLVEKCKENLKLSEDLEIKDLVKYNPCIEKSVKRPIQRDNFYENIENLNFKNLVRKNLPKRSLIKKIINKIILILKNGKVK